MCRRRCARQLMRQDPLDRVQEFLKISEQMGWGLDEDLDFFVLLREALDRKASAELRESQPVPYT